MNNFDSYYIIAAYMVNRDDKRSPGKKASDHLTRHCLQEELIEQANRRFGCGRCGQIGERIVDRTGWSRR